MRKLAFLLLALCRMDLALAAPTTGNAPLARDMRVVTSAPTGLDLYGLGVGVCAANSSDAATRPGHFVKATGIVYYCDTTTFLWTVAPSGGGGGGGLSGLTTNCVLIAGSPTTAICDNGLTYIPANDALKVTSSTFDVCTTGGTGSACGYSSGSGIHGTWFNKSSTSSGATGIGFARDGVEQYSLGHDFRTGRAYFALLWADKASFATGGAVQSGDIIGISWAGADSAGLDGPAFTFNRGGFNPSNNEYDATFEYNFGMQSGRTSGTGRKAAVFGYVNNQPGLSSGGVEIDVKGNLDALALTQPAGGSTNRATIKFGVQDSNNKYWRMGEDLENANGHAFSLYDYLRGAYAFQMNGTGLAIFKNNATAPLDVNGNGVFSGTVQAAAFAGPVVTSLGGQTGNTQTFAKTDDTNVGLTITSAANTHTFALGWLGRLAFSRLTQGSGLSVLGVTGNATADHASIVATQDGNVLRRSGTSLAFGPINLASAGAVTNVLPVANIDPLVALDADITAHAASGDHDSRYYTKAQLSTSDGDPPNLGSNEVNWNNIVGMPAGFADGSDDGPGATVPTGTGFRHVTLGAEDGATKLIDTADINNAQITLAKLQNIPTDTMLGRASAGTGVPEQIAVTAAGRALIDDANNTAQRATLGLGSLAVLNALGALADLGDLCPGNQTTARNSVDTANVCVDPIVSTELDTFGKWVTQVGVSGTCSSTTYVRGDGSCVTPPGSGDVVGPASATDNALARFDLATGKLIQNSVAILDDAGALSGLSSISSTCTPSAGDCTNTFPDNTTDPGAPASGLTAIFTVGGEMYKKDNGDGASKRLFLNDGNMSGDVLCPAGVCAVQSNAVALTTDTTGNYVQSIATSSPLTGGAAGSEGATLTLGISTGGIGPTEIASTAVTPGSYTNANITVDGDGRITAAANGAGGSTTQTAAAVIDAPTTADSGKVEIQIPAASTITRISCSTDTGTATVNVNKRAEATPNTSGTDVLSAGLVCDNNSQTSCSSGCDVNTISSAAISARQLLTATIASVASTPGIMRLHVEYTTP